MGLQSANHMFMQRILILLLIIVAGIYAYLFSLTTDGYMPSWSDEYFYFKEAQSFHENTTLHGAYLLSEYVSKIGDFGSHGFAYALLHGAIAKLFGFHALNLPVTNLALLVLTLFFIFSLSSLDLIQKMLIALLLLLYCITPLYLFTYMQETLQLLFAVILSVMLIPIHEKGPARAYLIPYLFFLVLFSFFRPLWMVWSIALIPLARNRKQMLLFGAAFFASLCLAYLLLALLNAPYPHWFISSLPGLLVEDGLFAAGSTIGRNVLENLGAYWRLDRAIPIFHIVSNYLLIAMTVYLLICGFRRKDRLMLAAGLIGSMSIVLVFLLYATPGGTGNRVLAPSFFLFSLLIAHRRLTTAGTVLLMLLLLQFPSVIRETTRWINEKKAVAQGYQSNQEIVNEFNKIAELIDDRQTTTVLVSRHFFRDGDIYLLCLPVKNTSGYPVRYTFNLSGNDLEIRNKSFVQYVLSPSAMEQGLLPVYQGKWFSLYRVLK